MTTGVFLWALASAVVVMIVGYLAALLVAWVDRRAAGKKEGWRWLP